MAISNQEDTYDVFRKVGRTQKAQNPRVQELLKKADLKVEQPSSQAHIPLLEEASGYQAVVYSSTCLRKPLYIGKPRFGKPDASGAPNRRRIYLYHTQGPENLAHYDVITGIAACLASNYYCAECYTPYDKPGKHRYVTLQKYPLLCSIFFNLTLYMVFTKNVSI